MAVTDIGRYTIETPITGVDRYEKVSFPIRYGRYSKIRSDDYTFQFNLNGELRYIMHRHSPHIEPTEWLKRTPANDWVFYSSGGYNGAIQTIGEHYIPCFKYRSNAITGGNPFKSGILNQALSEFEILFQTLKKKNGSISDTSVCQFIESVLDHPLEKLAERSTLFHKITDGPVTVLPPDARHVDYDLIPLSISEGCLYKCKFCTVKTDRPFRKKQRSEIDDQIFRLKDFFGADLKNYNSVFLGEQDALFSGIEQICYTAEKAHHEFGLQDAHIKAPSLFLFGSVDSLLRISETGLNALNRLPFHTWVNIGLESFDPETISILGKPVSMEKICQAFDRILEINRSYSNLTFTANFVIGDALPHSHDEAFIEKTAELPLKGGKGALYLSPFDTIKDHRKMLDRFKKLKQRSRIPTFLYLIQRL